MLSAQGSLKAQKPEIVKKYRVYCQQVQTDSFQRMVELKQKIAGIAYDLRYATPDNFTGKQLYRQGKYTYLRSAPAAALQKVQEELKVKGLGLKIFDAYRPYHVTEKMWELVHDERYVANPAHGSGHNRGLAVDLPLIDLATGKELEMGTGFDNFTDSAHQDFNSLPANVLQNRKTLKEAMEFQGFRALSTEWWHFSWPNDRNYSLLDLDFNKLKESH
jgi:D-alanyl-D-alanine dipeptidase